MGRVLEQLGEGGRPGDAGMDGQRNPPVGQALLEVAQGARIEAELGGDVHLEPGRAAEGLLALERLPENLIGDHRVTLGMAGNAHALDPASRSTPLSSRSSVLVKASGWASPRSPATSSTCSTPPASQRAQSIAQSLRIDDAPRDDMRRGREAQCLDAQRDADHVVGRRLRRVRHVHGKARGQHARDFVQHLLVVRRDFCGTGRDEVARAVGGGSRLPARRSLHSPLFTLGREAAWLNRRAS